MPEEKVPERRVREEEQEGGFDWGDAEEVLAPLHLHKPQVESPSGGQSSNCGDSDSNDDNDTDGKDMQFVMTRKKMTKADTPGRLTGLRAASLAPTGNPREENSQLPKEWEVYIPRVSALEHQTHVQVMRWFRLSISCRQVQIRISQLWSWMKNANGRSLLTLSVHLWRRIRWRWLMRYQK